MKSKILTAVAIAICGAVTTSNAVMDIPNAQPNVDPAAISRTVATPAAERKIRLVQNNGKISILRKDAENRWIEYCLNGKKLFKVQ